MRVSLYVIGSISGKLKNRWYTMRAYFIKNGVRRKWPALMILMMVASAWAGSAHDHSGGHDAHSFDFGEPADSSQATRSIEITLGDMYFRPQVIEVKAGETVRFVVHNQGQLLHEFNLGNAAMHAQHQQEMLNMQMKGVLAPGGVDHDRQALEADAAMRHDDPNSVLVNPGERAELVWTFARADRLEFACNVPGHYQAGMVGEIVVRQ